MIAKVCVQVLQQELAEEIREKALAYKERLGGFNWDRQRKPVATEET